MAKSKNNFNSIKVRNSKHLETLLTANIEEKKTAYYLILNEWDSPCQYFLRNLPKGGDTDLNIIDIFDVPNALDIMKSVIKSNRETISTSCLSTYDQLPMLIVIHKSFPRVVTYNGSVGAELGI
jgi:hypothetical protein